MFCLWDLARFLVLLLVSSASAFAQDPGWPRKLEKPGGTVIVYQPQVDEWKDYATITTRVAFQLTPIGGKQVIGAATMMGNSNVDKDKHMVVIYGIKVTDAFFPSLDETTSAKMEQLFRTLVPEVVNIPAQQQRQTTRQNRPSTPQPNSAATQQRSQYSNQTRSSSSTSTQNLNSEIQSRQRGTTQTNTYQRSSAGGSRTRSASGAGGARRR